MKIGAHFNKACLFTASIAIVTTIGTGNAIAANSQAYTIGENGSLVANSNAQLSVNQTDNGYNIDLAKGGLCFSVDQSTPFTITADGEPVNLSGFGVNASGSINGMVSVDDNGVYAGSTTTCEGVNSVTTTGDGLFGLDTKGLVILIAGIIGGIAAFESATDNSSGGNNVVTPIDPVVPPATPTTVPAPGGGGGGGGGTPVASPN